MTEEYHQFSARFSSLSAYIHHNVYSPWEHISAFTSKPKRTKHRVKRTIIQKENLQKKKKNTKLVIRNDYTYETIECAMQTNKDMKMKKVKRK